MQFITSLKKMSEICEFGASLNEPLHLIWGVKNSNVKKKLLSEGTAESLRNMLNWHLQWNQIL